MSTFTRLPHDDVLYETKGDGYRVVVIPVTDGSIYIDANSGSASMRDDVCFMTFRNARYGASAHFELKGDEWVQLQNSPYISKTNKRSAPSDNCIRFVNDFFRDIVIDFVKQYPEALAEAGAKDKAHRAELDNL